MLLSVIKTDGKNPRDTQEFLNQIPAHEQENPVQVLATSFLEAVASYVVGSCECVDDALIDVSLAVSIDGEAHQIGLVELLRSDSFERAMWPVVDVI